MNLSKEKRFVINAMINSGGSFVSALGVTLARADDKNTEKIKQAFPEYWKQYLEMGMKVK